MTTRKPLTPPNGRGRWRAPELRAAVIAAGEELLADGRPPTIEVPNVTLREVIEYTGLPRSSVYRVFGSKRGAGDQLANFQAELEVPR